MPLDTTLPWYFAVLIAGGWVSLFVIASRVAKRRRDVRRTRRPEVLDRARPPRQERGIPLERAPDR